MFGPKAFQRCGMFAMRALQYRRVIAAGRIQRLGQGIAAARPFARSREVGDRATKLVVQLTRLGIARFMASPPFGCGARAEEPSGGKTGQQNDQ